jgi:regulator of cell morphogenesis and NO signaling
MKITEENTVAEIVVQNIKTAHVFKKHGIDFCCGGGITIEKACLKNSVDYAILKKEIETISNGLSKAYNYDDWELDFLIDHIINVHHTYVEESIPLLLAYSNKVAHVHGHHYQEVVKINTLVEAVAQELGGHMKKEEVILFPYIKQLVKAEKEGQKLAMPPFGTVNNPIQMMFQEHENAGDVLKQIAKLSNDYTPPPGACNTFRALYSKLEEFEQDLHQHIHLENNILFPKAVELEQSI